MAGTFKKADPTPEILHDFIATGTGGATNAKYHGLVTVSVPVPQTTVTSDGTGNGGFLSWVNPESGTILVTDVLVYFSTTGTGTYDLGVSDDGTGTVADIIDGGAMNASVYVVRAYRGRSGTEGAGTAGMQDVCVVGPGGTGTNNSIVGRTTEVTSTAVGRVFITYVHVGA